MQIQMMVREPIVLGCTDSTAFNFDSDANIDDGSCISIVEGCTIQQPLIMIQSKFWWW